MIILTRTLASQMLDAHGPPRHLSVPRGLSLADLRRFLRSAERGHRLTKVAKELKLPRRVVRRVWTALLTP